MMEVGVMSMVDKRKKTDVTYLDFCRTLIQSHITSLSPDWRDMDLIDGLFSG